MVLLNPLKSIHDHVDPAINTFIGNDIIRNFQMVIDFDKKIVIFASNTINLNKEFEIFEPIITTPISLAGKN